MPLSLHILTGRRGSGVTFQNILRGYMSLPHSIQMSFADLVIGGVLERFPELKFVSAENDISWMPHFCYRLDHAYDRLRHFEGVNLKLLPSEYMKRQVWGTFQFETKNVGFTAAEYSPDRLMWSSDYPHTDSPWPNSRRFIDSWSGSIDQGARDKITGGNAAALYHVN